MTLNDYNTLLAITNARLKALSPDQPADVRNLFHHQLTVDHTCSIEDIRAAVLDYRQEIENAGWKTLTSTEILDTVLLALEETNDYFNASSSSGNSMVFGHYVEALYQTQDSGKMTEEKLRDFSLWALESIPDYERLSKIDMTEIKTHRTGKVYSCEKGIILITFLHNDPLLIMHNLSGTVKSVHALTLDLSPEAKNNRDYREQVRKIRKQMAQQNLILWDNRREAWIIADQNEVVRVRLSSNNNLVSADDGMRCFCLSDKAFPVLFDTAEKAKEVVAYRQKKCSHNWGPLCHDEQTCAYCGAVRLLPDVE